MIDLVEAFMKFEDEYLEFDRVEDKLHPRPDVCAFMLLDRMDPVEGKDMVAYAEHDEIFLGVDLETIAAVATEDDILTLVRCGVSYDVDHDGLSMFV